MLQHLIIGDIPTHIIGHYDHVQKYDMGATVQIHLSTSHNKGFLVLRVNVTTSEDYWSIGVMLFIQELLAMTVWGLVAKHFTTRYLITQRCRIAYI